MDVHQIPLAGGLFFAPHHEHVLKALVVFSAVLGGTVAHAVKLEALKLFNHFFGVKGAGHFTGVGVQQGLHIGRVGRL